MNKYSALWHIDWLAEKYGIKRKDVSTETIGHHLEILTDLVVDDPQTINGDLYDTIMKNKMDGNFH